MIKVYIPTLGRPDRLPTVKYLQMGGLTPTLVVQAHEATIYKAANRDCDIMVLPPSIRTISPTRQYILENSKARHIVMMDDDLRFSRKDPSNRTKLLEATEKDMADMLAMINSKLQRFAHVGVSLREGNNRRTDYFMTNERMIRVLGYDRDRIPTSCRFDRVPLKQDFDMTLQLLRNGLANCVIYEFAQDQVSGSNAVGGCSTFRTEEMSDQAAIMLHELHPEFVKLTRKSNSNWKQFKNPDRLEVIIQWKRAFEAGRQNRGAVS